jgi:hypothetical protein
MNETNRDYVRNLRVFNGMKVVLSLYALLGSSYLFCYYSIVTDSLQADEFRHSIGFLLVESALFTTPCLFLIAGFLHTFSFLQTETDKQFSYDNIKRFYVKKVLRFEALVVATLVFANFAVPMIGGGPVWETY